MKQFSGSSVLTRNPHVQPISFSRAQQSKPSKSWWFLRWGDFSTCHKLSLASSLTKMGPTSPSCRTAPLYTPVTLPDPSALYSPQSLSVPSPVLFSQTLFSWLQLRSCLLPGFQFDLERVFLYSELPLTGYRSEFWILTFFCYLISV